MRHWCNLAAKDRGLECTCVNNDFTVLVSGGGRRHWVSMCTVWPSHSKWHQILHYTWTFLHRNYLDDLEGHSYGQLVIGSFITTTCPLMYHISCRVFWQNIKSSRWLILPTTQIWCPVTSGFSKNQNHLWKGRDFRPLMRFTKIRQDSWWRLGELCEVPVCLLWRGLKGHCPVYNVSCILYLYQYISLFFILHGWIPSGQTSYIWL